MVAYKAAQTARILRKPDPHLRAYLLYGPEPGLVSDRGQILARGLAARDDPAGEIVRLDDASLAEDRDRLAVETQTMPMFGGRKVVRFRAGPRTDAAALEALIGGALEAYLIVEAGQLAPRAPLRRVFEQSAAAAALPCYGDTGEAWESSVEAELKAQGLSLAGDARAALMAQLAADPALARADIGKLALYVGNTGTARLEDVEAVIGDTSQAGLDGLANAVAAGQAREAVRQLDRLLAGGTASQAALGALTRHFAQLHRLCAAAETGGDVAGLLARAKPPLAFKQRDALTAQVRRWSAARAARALELLQKTTRDSRLRPELERQTVERALLELARAL